MPILRAGPWGNLTNAFQPVPFDTSGQLDYYPVNCAKTDWPSQVWTAWYEVEESGCNGPATITATSLFFGNIQLTKQAGDGCTYYWVSPYGPFSGGEAYIKFNTAGPWVYEQWVSYAPFDISQGGTDPDDPTGTYSGTFNTYTVTTP